jgi:peptide chain release factor 1
MLSSSKTLKAEEISKISKELSELTPVAEKVLELRSIENELNEAKSMLSDSADDELEGLIKSEINDLSNRLPLLKK